MAKKVEKLKSKVQSAKLLLFPGAIAKILL